MKYKLSDIKHRILQLENPTNYQEHKNYLTTIIDRSATEWTFPSWIKISNIGNYAFYYYTSLTSIVIPEGVTTIGNNAFFSCVYMTSISLPNSLITIGNGAFDCCYRLQNITIPSNVANIGNNAFMSCQSITDMYLYPITPPTLASTSAISNYTTTIHVPIGSGDAYKNATNWSSFADKIVEDIEV